MLATFGLAGGAAGVHEEERGFGVLRNRLDDLPAIVLEHVVHEKVAIDDHRGFGAEVALVTPPEEHFVDDLALFFRCFHGNIRAGFVIHPLAVAVITVSVDEHAAAGIGGPQAARFAAESAKHHGVNHAKPRASQHGDLKLRNHGHVNRDAVDGLEAG